MLCRISPIRHLDSGVSVKTPLLIPSFSSRGFARETKDGKPRVSRGETDVEKILRTASEFITDVCLVSAYDIRYKHISIDSELLRAPAVVFLDSGGYEIAPTSGYSSVFSDTVPPKPWTQEDLTSVFDEWPDHVPAVFVSFDHPDHRGSFDEQVRNARRLFQPYSKHLTLLLLKPETADQTTLDSTLRSARSNAGALERFDIIGVTEKELGGTMLDRMAQIARLRLAMDKEQVKKPIHIFGALDPLTVCLYYISGAEVFDGLSWLRYGYKNGVAMYTHNLGVIDYGLHERDEMVRARTLAANCYALESLKQRLSEFEATGKFSKLAPHDDLLKNACDSLQTRMRGRF